MFWKLLKFEICFKIRILLTISKIIKTVPAKFNKIYQSLWMFITVKVYCIVSKVNDCNLIKIC